MSEVYLGNPNLKKIHRSNSLRNKSLSSSSAKKTRCILLISTLKLLSLDEGLTQFHPYDFQEKLIHNFHNNRFNICKMPRWQTGKSTTVVSYLLHMLYLMTVVNIGILANKAATARELSADYKLLTKTYQNGCNRVSYREQRIDGVGKWQ